MKYFYFDADSQFGIESSAAIKGNLDDIIGIWESLSQRSGSFLGVRCVAGQALQFMWDDSECVTIDIPLPERRGSLTKSSSFQECRAAITHVCSGGDPTSIPGLALTKW